MRQQFKVLSGRTKRSGRLQDVVLFDEAGAPLDLVSNGIASLGVAPWKVAADDRSSIIDDYLGGPCATKSWQFTAPRTGYAAFPMFDLPETIDKSQSYFYMWDHAQTDPEHIGDPYWATSSASFDDYSWVSFPIVVGAVYTFALVLFADPSVLAGLEIPVARVAQGIVVPAELAGSISIHSISAGAPLEGGSGHDPYHTERIPFGDWYRFEIVTFDILPAGGHVGPNISFNDLVWVNSPEFVAVTSDGEHGYHVKGTGNFIPGDGEYNMGEAMDWDSPIAVVGTDLSLDEPGRVKSTAGGLVISSFIGDVMPQST